MMKNDDFDELELFLEKNADYCRPKKRAEFVGQGFTGTVFLEKMTHSLSDGVFYGYG